MAVFKPTLLAAALLALTSQANAGLLDYNLALQNNLTGAVHVEGMTFVGGNLTATQISEFNHGGDTPVGTFDGLEVGGKVSGQVKILGGETAVYKTKDASAQIQCVGGSANCATGGVDLSAKKQALSNEMVNLSSSYKNLGSNANALISGNQVKLQYTGSGTTAIFNLSAADLFFQNSSIELALGNASKAIINVAGNLTVTNTNLTGAWNYSNTLWNFYDATSVSFNAMAVKGSVLAAGADVFDGGGFDGSLYAKSYTNTTLREIHGFFWTPPTTNTVPEPEMLGLMLGGLGLIGLARLRRRG